jgi:acyl-CoA synthetase (AMP-forming)/AMP-acid ligase II
LPPGDLDRKPGSVGIAIPNTELWLVDERGERVGPGEVGELVIRGATVMQGYWEKPELTARKLRPGPLPGERVLYTGDLCRLDEDGYLYFVGRMDDVIKSRGEKVAPREVENALADIPGVAQAAVKGIPDPVLGHAIKAFVVRSVDSTLTERDVIAACRARLEPFMVPSEVVFVPGLPTTATGKVRREDL